jgi:CubicO group peptidase (beta-lactamase class C family)
VKRTLRWVGAGILLVVVIASVEFRPDRVLRVAAGMSAHTLCSAIFVAGLDPEMAFREQVQPQLGAGKRLVHYRVDRADRSVEASFAHLVYARARFSPGYGCRLESTPAPSPRPASPPPTTAGELSSPTPVATSDPVLSAALERVFTESPNEPVKDVKAVVVVKDGRVIAERYAPGFGIDTPLISYSVAKSFTNALLGILVRQGRLHADQPVGAPEWRAPDDPRGQITIEDLVRMRSGLDAAEADNGFDAVSRMLFVEDDMAGFAAKQPLKQSPGAAWEYTSADTLILDRLIGSTAGGGSAGLRAFAQDELFAPLHMESVTMEFDGAGTFVGATNVYASARDYARFGELYVNDGIAMDGRRILPEGWVAWSRRSTLGTSYGAGFWTNDGPSRGAAFRVSHGFPKDGFYASGNLGQRIYIIPSQHLVITRFGYSRPPDFGIEDDLALINATIRATSAR